MRLYGEGPASVLAKTWCNKLQYLFDIALASGKLCHRFSEDELQGWLELYDFKALVVGLEGKQLARAQWLRSLKPGLVA